VKQQAEREASATPSDYFTALTRLQSSVPIASERGSFITSPSSLGTSASATSFNMASATPSLQLASATPSDYFTALTRLQSSVPIASEHGSFITSPSSLGSRHLGFGHFVQHGFGHPFSTGSGNSKTGLTRTVFTNSSSAEDVIDHLAAILDLYEKVGDHRSAPSHIFIKVMVQLLSEDVPSLHDWGTRFIIDTSLTS
jgi:hypothetical protein